MEFKAMATPASLWLKDDGGADIRGFVDIAGRDGRRDGRQRGADPV